MARVASGREFLEEAKAGLAKAKTVNQLRQAQAVVLPLELGLSLEQTAQMLGVSEGWACQLRIRFIRNGGRLDEDGPGRGGRRRANLSREEEAAFLAPFLEQAKAGGILVVGEIKQALDQRLGRKTALASVYYCINRRLPSPRNDGPALLAGSLVRRRRWRKNIG